MGLQPMETQKETKLYEMNVGKKGHSVNSLQKH
jgi:hypothetical protein